VFPDAETVYSHAHVAVIVTLSVWAAAGMAVIASSPAATTELISNRRNIKFAPPLPQFDPSACADGKLQRREPERRRACVFRANG
jgi:hypothetical protein